MQADSTNFSVMLLTKSLAYSHKTYVVCFFFGINLPRQTFIDKPKILAYSVNENES